MNASVLYDSGHRNYAPRQREMLMIAVLVIAVVITNIMVVGPSPTPWVRAVAGFLMAIPLPAWMLSQKIDWRTDSPTERLLYSVVMAILGLIVVGLLINTVLPLLGISRPLDRGPVLVAVDVYLALLGFWRYDRFVPRIPRPRLDRLGGADWGVGILSALCVPLAIMGANRLNNGAGSGLTLAMLILAAIVLVFMFAKRETLNPGTLSAAVYFLSAAMLLMTSLRGWYITGHDIQTEYYVFQLTKNAGHWNMGVYQDAYNACLSLTILPTMLWQLMRIDDPYIYKFWFQLLFALCPLFVYRISVRYTTRAMAIIAVIYFIAFPTFFTDMPYLNRQEIAYLFVGACIMMATSQGIPRKDVRIRVAIFSLGVVLSHYSTSYVFLGTIALAWFCYKVFVVFRFVGNNGADAAWSKAKKTLMTPSVGLLNVLLLLAGIGLWNGVATHTVTGLGATLTSAVNSLRGGTGTKSADASYSLVGGAAPTEAQLFTRYTQATFTQTDPQRTAENLYTAAEIKKYPMKYVPLANLPVTSAGKAVDTTGLNVSSLNSLLRSGAARVLQLFVLVGLISAIIGARKRRSAWMVELIAVATAALAIVALQVVLPGISVAYGILRAFQQALIAFGPLVAVGSLAIFRFLPEKWGLRAAFGVSILFFASLVGTIPQILGGYPPQVNLNSSGQYYDLYYTHPQSITAVDWLQSEIPRGTAAKPQPLVDMDYFAYQELRPYTSLSIGNSDFPSLINKNAYVFLGYQTVSTGLATAPTSGDLITFTYPLGLLNSSADLIYSSNGAMIYR